MEPSSSQNSLFTIPNNSMIQDSSKAEEKRPQADGWSWEENKVFENALAEFGLKSEVLIPNLALRIPTKSMSQLEDHLKALEDDINRIDCSDFDEILDLLKSDTEDDSSSKAISMMKKNEEEEEASKKLSEARSVPIQRRRGIPWTKTEHEMFLLGLERYGRGDWRGISRHLVPSKTPTQIASHAQKYFLKLKNPKSRLRKDGSLMRTVDDSQKPTVENVQPAISDDKKAP